MSVDGGRPIDSGTSDSSYEVTSDTLVRADGGLPSDSGAIVSSYEDAILASVEGGFPTDSCAVVWYDDVLAWVLRGRLDGGVPTDSGFTVGADDVRTLRDEGPGPRDSGV